MTWRINQKKTGPYYHRLKTLVKRSIEQNLRIKIFGVRNGNYRRNAMVKNQVTKQGGQNFWRLLAMASLRAVFERETTAVSSTIGISVRKNDTVKNVSEFFHAAK